MRLLARFLVMVVFGLTIGPAHAAPGHFLHVSLYPYIPEPEAAALTLKQGFERLHPDVIVTITFNQNYYRPEPAAKGVLHEDADLHVSLPAYRTLLIPAQGEAPRYLLPATQTALDDARLQNAAPLYPQFRAIIDQGVVVTTLHLNATLHDVAEHLDKALPQVH